ncbi:23S rRNA (pseudouridine(1915)-N(3))-methyltransferase RlmH [Roseibium porphyridii]|uniref:Ribosomal RNA large subunit methyltransferase H n=1 Tax=Roseibium porphyridii TaxID=2866279 RepID=A0ABY8F6F7_9HYPH|nr:MULTISPECIES: 23S rRNA (pseudouridine(1915)-N(3))-methyltransferase RlmH [Stappiaceae]QFT34470.1 Ribosomal RNA large subunit methyltransferase H [Labrenzia sp. THAF82]WFE89445.1 23S rRNA (pseudouridine(1915)-N(3))-methyltransferase RlmH [Roseibium sp. KMA01]
MRFTLSCIGRMKAGADKDLFDRYLDRARKSGRGLGITGVSLSEHPESRAQRPEDRKAEEAKVIQQSLPPGARLIVLDEHGKNLTSPAFSQKLEGWKDEGISEVVFAIGGADGHGQELLERADLKLALGAMTWPHQIARILLAEQIYRAITIQAGHPYHRV